MFTFVIFTVYFCNIFCLLLYVYFCRFTFLPLPVCSIIAIFGCCFLIFLIKKRTVMEMKSYSKILLQGCVVDLLFALSSLISAPVGFQKIEIYM